MTDNILTGNKLPAQVFSKEYPCYLLVNFTEAVINQKVSFFEVIMELLRKEAGERFIMSDISNKPVKVMDVEVSTFDPEKIASFMDDYKDENGISYFNIVASTLFFANDKHSIAIFCDRSADTCVIGCSENSSVIITGYVKRNDTNTAFLNFMPAKQYVQSNYLSDEFKDALIQNYLK